MISIAPRRFLATWVWGLVLLVFSAVAGAELAVPALRAHVTDQTGTLDPVKSAALEERLKQFEAAKGSQIAVLVVASTQPEAIEQYSMRVAEAWKLGRKGVDDGILLLVAKEDRAVRIEVGYGLEGAVSDANTKRIIEEEIVPRFRQGDFAGGIDAAVTRLIGLVNGEPLPEPTHSGDSSLGGLFDEYLPMVLLFAFVGGGILRAIFGRFLGATLAGGLGFMGAWWLLGAFGMALVFGFFVFIVTLVAGSSGIISGGGGGGWSSGGGGYSGGGGGFGGGGASGRW
jgi:uncharacterized protein